MRLQISKNGAVVVYRVPECTSEAEKKALEKEAKLLAGHKVDKKLEKKRNFYKRTVYQSKLFK